ncbi:MAG: type II secretion system protein [Candidatus Saccharibacteria bacterium]
MVNKRQSGFTIVELLIVIVVIGILAALVITTFSGIQQKGRDTKRQTDIKALHSQLEAFFAQNGGGYPVMADVNTASWRNTQPNMKGLDEAALCDPSNATQTNCQLVATPAAQSYAYQVWDVDGTTACTSTTGQTCPKYTLTATLEGTINGSGTYVKKSLN